MKKLLILLSTISMSSTGVLSLTTKQSNNNSILNNSNFNNKFFNTYANTINNKVGQYLNIYDSNGLGKKELEIEFIKDVAQYKIDTNNVFLSNLVNTEGKARDNESFDFLKTELKIEPNNDIFDYNYLKAVKIEISNIKCDVVKEEYDNEQHLLIQNGSYLLKFVDSNGKTLGQDNYQVNAKQDTSAFFDMLKSTGPAALTYDDFVYPGSPIETFRVGTLKTKAEEWENKKIEVPLIHGDNIPSNVKKFNSYQALIGWKVSFKVNTVETSWWNTRFDEGDKITFSINYTKGTEKLVYSKVKAIILVE